MRKNIVLSTFLLLLGIFTTLTIPSSSGQFGLDDLKDKFDDIQGGDEEDSTGDEETAGDEETDDEENPDEDEEPPTDECPSGTVRDDESDECIPNETDDNNCTGDEVWNEDTNTCDDKEYEEDCEGDYYWNGEKCVPPDHCLDDEYWNEETHKCEKQDDDDHDCPDGWYWNGDDCLEIPHCDPPYHWDEKDQRCEVEYDKDIDVNYNVDRNIDNCQKSFIVAVDTLRLPGCLVSSANGIGVINFLERNFDNIIVSNNMLPNVLLSFTTAELKSTSSGQNVITKLTQIASKDGTTATGVDQIQMVFKVNWNPQPDTSSNNFTYCKGEDCETNKYSITF